MQTDANKNLAERLTKRFEALKGDMERTNWESHCDQVAEVVYPKAVGFTGRRTPGEKRVTRLYDPTGVHARTLLSAGLHGLATNPGASWFSLSLADEKLTQDDEAKQYLSDVEDVMWSEMYAPGTGLVTALNELYDEMISFGPGAMFITWDDEEEHLVFNTHPMNEVYIAESNKQKVDTVFRRFQWSVRQIVEEWGKENVSDEVMKLYREGKLDERREICHAIYPRRGQKDRTTDAGKDAPENMPFASVYLETDTKHVLHNGGFLEFPWAIPRWTKGAGEVYGRSPAMTALPFINMLQQMVKTTIVAAQKMTDPPLFAPDDAFIAPLRTVPGGVNFYRGSREIFPMPFNGNLPVTMEMMDGIRNQIRTIFFVDQLQFVMDANMTATEVMQRTQERMRLLGPVLGRLESELLGVMVERIFGVLDRAGRLPPPPEIVQERNYTVEYTSPIAQAQKAVELDAIPKVFELIAMYQNDPASLAEAMEILPIAKVLPYVIDKLNIDPDMVASEEELAALAQQKQQMQQMQAAQQTAGIAEQSAGALDKAAGAALKGGQADGAALGANMAGGAESAQGLTGSVDPALLDQLQQALGQQ